MKRGFEITFLTLVMALILSCGVSHKGAKESPTGRLTIKDTSAVKDSVEYELIVFDPGFDYWFAGKGFYKHMYSNHYLQTTNYRYVIEWNRRYSSGDRLIESYIDYSPSINYDFEFNFKLFMYFLYFEESNKVTLVPGVRRRF